MKDIAFVIFSVLLVISMHLYASLLNFSGRRAFVPPPRNIYYFNFDYNDMLSSLLWIRLLQDIDVCDQNATREPLIPLEGGENAVDQILARNLPQAQCRLGWVYQMTEVITDLTPDFYFAFETGALFLSVLVDDREGAQRIYTKGLHYFPEEWPLLYKAAYHALFEMQKPNEAAELLLRAGRRGAPKWVYALSANLYTKVGQAHFALSILEAVMSRNPKGLGVDRIEKRLAEIKVMLKVDDDKKQ